MKHVSIPHLERLSAIRSGLLYPHQADGIAFLLSKKRALLADDMGLGKTRQAIVTLESAAAEGVILVVCPASLKLNWKREILMVDPTARIEVIGHDRQPLADPRWVIVNYDLLTKEASRLHDIAWSGVILDEAHFIKNASGRTSHCLKLLGVQNGAKAPLIGPEFVFLLTGTPMTNCARPVQSAAMCGSPGRAQFSVFREALL
jgi:SWI/SNF-related matrix-associated actin-dependent regulator 1 of chromatin subfamily A